MKMLVDNEELDIKQQTKGQTVVRYSKQSVEEGMRGKRASYTMKNKGCNERGRDEIVA